MGSTNVQGMNLNNMNYEIFRTVGFPAIAQTHVTFGIGWDITRTFVVNLSYMHSFEETFSQSSTMDLAQMESTMSQDSLSFGLTWRF